MNFYYQFIKIRKENNQKEEEISKGKNESRGG